MLYVNTKKMNFEEDNIEHDIVLSVHEKKGKFSVDFEINPDEKFVTDTLQVEYKKDDEGNDTKEILHKRYVIKEQKTWHSFPLYEIIDGKIIDFDYTQYQYFNDTDRRVVLARKIGKQHNPSSELKIMRKTLKKILDHLGLEDESFNNYNNKVEKIIKKIPKGGK